MRLYVCDHHEIPLPAGHKFPRAKYRLLREELERTGLFTFEAAPLATDEDLTLVHDAAYVRGFLSGMLSPAALREIGFPWSEALVKRTLASAGSTLAATADAVVTGIGGGLAGGTHHAFRGEGAGFCVFNDIAVAIERFRRDGRIRRAAVVDLDVHQGDGTAAIFAGDPNVLTASVHCDVNFPFRKRQSRIDVSLAAGARDEEYLRAVENVMARAMDFRPDAVWFQAGVDGLASDRLGRLALTLDGLRERDRIVFEACRSASVPCVIALGGGYAEPIENTVRAHAGTFLLGAEIFHESRQPV